ncbi:MAG: T9SS type A sorting domain-containing protein [Bacteroidota bacterium]
MILILLNSSVFGQSKIKTMFYNVLEFPNALPGGRDQILQNILAEYQPDIFMVCELQGQEGADQILNTSLNGNLDKYDAAPYFDNQSGASPLQQLIFYRRDKFTLEDQEVINTDVRDINRYVLQLNTLNGQTDPVLLDIYVTHLKSSQGSSNENQRLDMVRAFTDRLGSLDPNSFVIFAGDLNVYSSDEPAYQELLDPTNPITMADPIDTPGDWHTDISFQDIHTQSTRVDSGPFGAGAGGGMDDRFDFILVSENMLSDPTLRYVENTYKAYGNNGNCYNRDISDGDCAGEYSQSLRNSLFSMSDHTPVIMELETDQEIILSGTDIAAENQGIKLKSTVVVETITLDIPYIGEESIDIEIYNALGQRIMNPIFQHTGTHTLDISHWASGLYYVKTTSLPNTHPIKFIKR